MWTARLVLWLLAFVGLGLSPATAEAASLSITWLDNATTETGYKIERCQGAGCVPSVQIAITGPNVTSYLDSTLADGTVYGYRLRATNATTDSAYSSIVYATTAGVPVAELPPPTGVAVVVPAPPSQPTVSLTATPASITAGGASTLGWSSTNATGCTASGGWSGAKATTGSEAVTPPATTGYTLSCTGPGGSAGQSIQVTVTPVSGGGGTVNASSCSVSAINTAMSAATAGQTVQVPAGTCSWSTHITVSKAITIRGAGIGVTTITRSGAVFVIGSGVRIAGFTFTNGQIAADGDDWRVDHNRFTAPSNFYDAITVWGARATVHPRGVIDHNQFAGGARVLVVGYNGLAAHALWAQPHGLGNTSGQKVFIEDNTFTYSTWSGVVDSNYGGRYVFRKNSVTNGYLEVHSLQQGRASQTWEVSDNTFSGTNNGNWVPMFIRGGTGVVSGNVVTGTWSNPAITLDNVRSFDAAGRDFGACNGNSTADGNQASNGWPCRDQIGRGSDAALSTPSSTASTATGWKAQASEPAYFWGNTAPGGGVLGVYVHNGTSPWIVAGRDFFQATPKPGYTPFAYPHPAALVP